MKAKRKKIEILDASGAMIGYIDRAGTVHAKLGGLGDGPSASGSYTPWGSIGGDIWEWLHPEQVQAEYTAVGKDAPSAIDITSGAASDALDRANAGISSALNAGQNLTRWIVIGLVAYAAIQLLSHIPKPRRS